MAMSDPYHVFIGFNRLDTPYMQMLEGIGTNILTPEFQRRVAEKAPIDGILINDLESTS